MAGHEYGAEIALHGRALALFRRSKIPMPNALVGRDGGFTLTGVLNPTCFICVLT
mgnify:CR=1 FL=1